MPTQLTPDELWRVAQRIMEQSGVREWRLDLDELKGLAEPNRGRIVGPELKSLESLYIVVHECGHISLKHDDRIVTTHRGEYEAEQFAQLVLRYLGYSVSAGFVHGGQDYVASHVDTAIAVERLTEIDRQSFAWAEGFLSPESLLALDRGEIRLVSQADAQVYERVIERFAVRHSEVIGGRKVKHSPTNDVPRRTSDRFDVTNN